MGKLHQVLGSFISCGIMVLTWLVGVCNDVQAGEHMCACVPCRNLRQGL